MITVREWLSSIEVAPAVTVHHAQRVEGLCKLALGGRFLFAKVGIVFCPSEDLVFRLNVDERVKDRVTEQRWGESICLGVLDVMLTGPPTPVTRFDCTIDAIEFHAVDSSRQAFRLAGRRAALQFLAAEPFNRNF